MTLPTNYQLEAAPGLEPGNTEEIQSVSMPLTLTAIKVWFGLSLKNNLLWLDYYTKSNVKSICLLFNTLTLCI